MLWWSVKAFHDEDPDCHIHLVLPEAFMEEWGKLQAELPETERIAHSVCPGGSTRTESVESALREIPEGDDVFVAVHDAARPLVGVELIARGWKAAEATGAAVPAVAVVDSLRLLTPDGGSRSVVRSDYVAVQTPQVFRSTTLHAAYAGRGDGAYTDDASVTEAFGITTVLYEGSHDNMKVTNPGDLETAALFMTRHGRIS